MATGNGRDYGDLGARLDKYVDRLPEYAERAQRQLRKHLPADQRPQVSRDPAVRPPAQVSDDELRRRAKLAVRARHKLERRRKRASRATTLWVVVTIVCAILVVAGAAGLAGATASTALAGALIAVPAAALAIRSGLRLRELNRRELPATPEPLQLPPSTSDAYEPMQRLARSEASLSELLVQLDVQAGSGPAVGGASVEQARTTAREAEQALRGLAARIAAIERAADAAPQGERAALDSAVRTLRQQLDDGVDSYGKLLAAAGHAVASSGGGIADAQHALTDATDHLAGMAIALRELGQ